MHGRRSRLARSKSTPWADYEGEMCRKTVARRHSKVLPMSTSTSTISSAATTSADEQSDERQELPARPPLRTIAEKLDALTKAQDAVPDPADDYSAPVPHYVADEFAGYIPPEPPAPEVLTCSSRIRERARADAEKRIRRMAPTALSAEEREVLPAGVRRAPRGGIGMSAIARPRISQRDRWRASWTSESTVDEMVRRGVIPRPLRLSRGASGGIGTRCAPRLPRLRPAAKNAREDPFVLGGAECRESRRRTGRG